MKEQVQHGGIDPTWATTRIAYSHQPKGWAKGCPHHPGLGQALPLLHMGLTSSFVI